MLCARRRNVHNGTKIQIRAKEIFVIGATKNVDVHHRTGVLYLYGIGAQIQRRAKYIFVIRATDNSAIQTQILAKGIYFSDEIGDDNEFAYFIVENYERTFRKVK